MCKLYGCHMPINYCRGAAPFKKQFDAWFHMISEKHLNETTLITSAKPGVM